MAAFFIFVLKSAFVLAMLVSLFMIFMSRETFHRVNRFVMLSIICIALLLPAVNLGVESPFKKLAASIENCFASEESDGIAIDISGFDEQPVFTDVALDIPSLEPAEEKPFDWLLLVAVLYFAGVAFLVVRQAVMYVQVARIIVRSRVADASQYGCEGISLRVHSGKEKPFSWFRWVVVSEEDLKDGVREILVHETAHARAGHSWDIMIADAVIIMQWFNPIAWIMKNCLKDIHEFEADEAVINSGVNARQYQLLIIKKAVGARLYSIANSFNHSLTKKRITMMCKEKSKMWRCAKALYIVPVAAIAALAFTTVETVNATESEYLSKGSEFVANNERECIENCITYSDCTVKPQFPGGEAAYREWLDSFSEPLAVKAEGATYDIDFFFVVTKKGKVADYLVGTVGSSTLNHETKKSLNKEFDRMRESLPDGWTPGEVDGKPVDVCMTVKFTNVSKDVDVKTVPEDDEEKVFQVCEKVPEFPGGSAAMMKFLAENIKYPADALEAGKGGKAFLQFVVRRDGSVNDVVVMKSSGMPSLDDEALRVVRSMPKWNPGMQGGKPVNVRFMIPVVFKLPKESPKIVLKGGGVAIDKENNASIVVDGELYNSNVADINSQDIESITVVEKERLSADELKKYNAVDKDGVIFFTMKKPRESKAVESKQNPAPEQMPEFPGGIQALMKFLQTNIKYPLEARKAQLQGKIYVQFVVKSDGSIANVEAKKADYSFHGTVMQGSVEEMEKLFGEGCSVERLDDVVAVAYANGEKQSIDTSAPGKHPAAKYLTAEAVRVVSVMPKWTPGMQDGKPVNVQYMLPVMFRLQ